MIEAIIYFIIAIICCFLFQAAIENNKTAKTIKEKKKDVYVSSEDIWYTKQANHIKNITFRK